MKRERKNKPKPKFYLWPDEDGLLILPEPPAKLSGASRMMRSRPLTRVAKKVLFGSQWLHIQNARIRMMNLTPVGFGVAIEMIFVTWLTTALLDADFNAISLNEVTVKAGYDLGLNEETILRLLIKHTARGARFKSHSGLLTFREDAL